MLNLILWPRSAGMEEVLFMAEFYCSWMILCHKFFQIHPNFSKRTGPLSAAPKYKPACMPGTSCMNSDMTKPHAQDKQLKKTSRTCILDKLEYVDLFSSDQLANQDKFLHETRGKLASGSTDHAS